MNEAEKEESDVWETVCVVGPHSLPESVIISENKNTQINIAGAQVQIRNVDRRQFFCQDLSINKTVAAQ